MAELKAFTSYEEAIEAERKREQQRRHTRQGAFEASFVSFEENTEQYFPLAAVISSRTKDDPVFLKTALRRSKTAHERVRRNIPECLEVFNLILRNGKERQVSIWAMVKKIKKQSGVLKKTRSTPSKKTDTTDTAQGFFGCSASKSRKTARTKKRSKMTRKIPPTKKS